jgi:hypothetical protein
MNPKPNEKRMNAERRDFLNLVSPPARMNASEAAWKLGFEPDHIPILVSAGLLKPVGNIPPGGVKFFLRSVIEQNMNDDKWMTKASEAVRLKFKEKNERAASNRARRRSLSATSGQVEAP